MNRLHAELTRLFFLPGAGASHGLPGRVELVGSAGEVRAMVLELSQAAGWDAMAAVWRDVQLELEMPAPAIAVTGIDGFQLWFSLAQPVSSAQAGEFLVGLQQRYLGAVKPEHVRAWPLPVPGVDGGHSVPMVPARQPGTGHWSAFVTHDLAALFADEPWLDQPPGVDAQAELLARLASADAAAFERALQRLAPSAAAVPAATLASPPAMNPAATGRGGGDHRQDARQFLLAVMNDPAVDMRLRIEAAKALL